MIVTVAITALLVALQYVLIAVVVVPRLVGLARDRNRLITVAAWGAGAFFTGCGLTHVGIAVHSLSGVYDGSSGWHIAVEHLIPHIAQALGGWTFIVIAYRQLDLRLDTKGVAARLRDLEARFRAAFERAPSGMALISLHAGSQGRLLDVNPALAAMIGDRPEAMRGRQLDDLSHPADRPRGRRELQAIVDGATEEVRFEQRYRHRQGHDVWVEVQASVVRDDAGSPLYQIAQIRDVTEHRRRDEQLRYLADHDPLTGLYNRRRFEAELERTVDLVRRYHEPAALLVLDLDQFKYINDTYGHPVGDELLRRVAQALSTRVRDTDVLCRLGGDEFGLICPHTEAVGAAAVAESLLEVVRNHTRVTVAERPLRVTASIGVKCLELEGSISAEQLMVDADIALYDAKETGRDRASVVAAGSTGAARMRERLTWSQRVREALENRGLVLWEQPILNLVSGRLDRAEVLVRMVDPENGTVIAPGEFLHIAERFGQIHALDRFVISAGIELIAKRQAAGICDIIEINLSGSSITDEPLIDVLTSEIANSGIDPRGLMFEVTETEAIVNFDQAREFARRLSDLGCRFALDDFGSGFGSFYYLKHLPFDCIKIDGDFIKKLPTSQPDRMIVKSIVDIAKSLGRETTAEFVQDDQTLQLLGDLGVDYAQGYHISEPRAVAAP